MAVGAFNDNNTGSSALWFDDSMWPLSRYVNPPSAHSDREKPEIAAPGVDITTTDFCLVGSCGFVTVSGTSLAAPAAAGIAALVEQRSSTIGLYPTAVKAVLMASAIHNIEGAAELSNQDGAGGVVASYADAIVTGAWGSWGAGAYACSAATDITLTTFSAQAGQTYRVAMAWLTDPAYAGNNVQPSADVDLKVIRPGGSLLDGSFSWDSTSEIVQFVAPANETLTLIAHKSRCDSNPKQLGWAWIRVV